MLKPIHMPSAMSIPGLYPMLFGNLHTRLIVLIVVTALVIPYVEDHFALAAELFGSSWVPNYGDESSLSSDYRDVGSLSKAFQDLQENEGFLAEPKSQPPGKIRFHVPVDMNDIRGSKAEVRKRRREVVAEGPTFVVSQNQISGSTSRRRWQQEVASELESEVESLSAFKAAIFSDPFKTLESWRANDSTPCSWVGVVCSSLEDSSSSDRHVIALNLRGRQLVGNIDSALLALGGSLQSSLESLDLSANVFTGSISGAALLNWSSLSYMNVSYNHVTGEIPFLIGELTNLENLDFENNNLTGGIPVSIANCTMLRTLNLGTNLLGGNIPQELGSLLNLQFLNLGTFYQLQTRIYLDWPFLHNSFSGTIPASLGNCSSLTYFSVLFNTNLGGQIPSELGQLQRLQVLALTGCSFMGVIPSWIGNLSDLTVIRLARNQLHGEVPDMFGQLQSLTFFAAGLNNLTGEFPESIFNCTLLTYLSFQCNTISGIIPPKLGVLSNLKNLYLNENHFTGVIPSTMANCSSLMLLKLHNNFRMDKQSIPSWMGSLSYLWKLSVSNMNFRSGIPDELGKLSTLTHLGLDGNELTGGVPASLANCTSLETLWLNSNNLEGEIPPEIGTLRNLTDLDFSNNFLRGSLPLSFTNLTSLQYLQMKNNLFHGVVAGNWGLLSELRGFGLSGNQFDGPIPEKLTNSSSLLYIDLSSNRFSGEVQPSFGNLSSLERLVLSNNQIRGLIPLDLVRCLRLGELDLTGNNFTGVPLSNMGALSLLQRLYLGNNNFVGAVPDSFGNYSNLLSLDLSQNQLSGNLPGYSFLRMSSLTSLNLSHNSFSGSWANQLNCLEVIDEIDLSANNLSGPIPDPKSGEWTALVTLDISMNEFSGAIPRALGSLQALTFFNASYNSFEGSIPDTGVFSRLTERSFLGNPKLCGVVLGTSRGCMSLTENLTTEGSCQGWKRKCKGMWISTICAGAAALVVLVVVGISIWKGFIKRVCEKRAEGAADIILNFDSHVRFSKSDVLKIIDGSGGNVIQSNGRTVVYKGSFSETEIFAIKALLDHTKGTDNGKISEGQKQLAQEAEILAKLRHRNILKVRGFCSIQHIAAMIVDYMPRGSLHDHLYPIGGASCELPWQARFNIASDVVQGMKYLHYEFPRPIIHGDLKPSNILLDEDFVAKVADFGLSKFVNQSRPAEATASSIRGTVGYIPPEYSVSTRISTKGDVYGYGMVLLELLTGRSPCKSEDFGLNADYRSWVVDSFWKVGLEVLDPILKEESTTDSVKREQMLLVLRVALLCTIGDPRSRPSTSDVFLMLSQTMELGQELLTKRTIQELVDEDA